MDWRFGTLREKSNTSLIGFLNLGVVLIVWRESASADLPHPSRANIKRKGKEWHAQVEPRAAGGTWRSDQERRRGWRMMSTEHRPRFRCSCQPGRGGWWPSALTGSPHQSENISCPILVIYKLLRVLLVLKAGPFGFSCCLQVLDLVLTLSVTNCLYSPEYLQIIVLPELGSICTISLIYGRASSFI